MDPALSAAPRPFVREVPLSRKGSDSESAELLLPSAGAGNFPGRPYRRGDARIYRDRQSYVGVRLSAFGLDVAPFARSDRARLCGRAGTRGAQDHRRERSGVVRDWLRLIHDACGCVLGDDLAYLGFRHARKVALDHFARTGPRRVRMRKVGRPHKIVDPYIFARHHADTVVLESCPHLPMEVVARRIRNHFLFEIAVLLVRMVEALQIMRDPSDVVFYRDKL